MDQQPCIEFYDWAGEEKWACKLGIFEGRMSKYIVKKGDSISLADQLLSSGFQVDAIITDPPYNISRKNNFHTIGRAGIHFGNWDEGFDQTSWIRKMSPLVKEGGSVLIFNDWKNMTLITDALAESGFVVKDLLRWVKDNPMPRNVNRRYVTDFEFIVWAVKKGGKWTFNSPYKGKYSRPEFKRPLINGSTPKLHPTQKPVELMKDLVRIHTRKGDMVFDPFMGSGSTGVACVELSRSFMGIEKSSEYFGVSKKRIEKAVSIKTYGSNPSEKAIKSGRKCEK